MSIDWSKYGGTTTEKKKGVIDWSKYDEPVSTVSTPTSESGAIDWSKYDKTPVSTPTDYDLEQEKIQMIRDNPSLAPAVSLPTYEAPPEKELPWLVQVQKDIYDNTLGPIQKGAMRLAGRFANEVMLDQPRRIMEEEGVSAIDNPFTSTLAPAENGFEKAIDYTAMGAAPLVGGGIGMKAAAKLAPNAGRILGSALGGAGGMLTYQGLKEGAELATGDEQSIGGRLLDVGIGTAIGGGLGAAAPYVGAAIGKGIERLKGSRATKAAEVMQPTPEVLALPPASRYESAKARAEGNVLPTNETPIYGQGDIKTFELPEPTIPGTIRNIQEEVGQRITPPYENPNELAKYVQSHLGDGVSLNEVRRLNYDDLSQMADEIHRSYNPDQVASTVARNKGLDWQELQQGRSVTGSVARPIDTVAYKTNIKTTANKPKIEVIPSATPSTSKYAAERQAQQTAQPSKYAQEREAVSGSNQRLITPKPQGEVDELKFAQTVKDSPNSAADLVTAMEDTPLKGARTSDVMNRQQAGELIEKHGREGLYSKLVSKKVTLSPAESTAAQKLAKHYSSQGGKENMAKAIALIGKTAREGREMGQAIQALSQWNKLDETGALLLGERQLNKGVKDTADWKSLTPEQAMPIQEAAQRVGQAQEVKSLADEVMSIVTNKKPGEALTDAEKATIKQFQDQVKTINEKTRPFLPKAKSDAAETIEKVSKIKPKERTRDQVVDFLDAKAEAARKRLEARRNVGILPKVDNPVFDYAIIGASHVAKGIRNYADYSELMLKDFGEQVKPYMKEAYLKSVNMFRRENGLPTKEDLEKVVNTAIKANKLDSETANSLRVAATEIGFYADKNLKLEATQDLQKALKELGDSSLGEKVSTVLTGAQLLNAVTIGRNVIGNVGQQLLEKINKIHAVPIDWALSQITKERTIKFFPHNQEKQWKNVMLGGKAGWEGVSPTGTLSSYDIHPEVFGKKNPLKYISKALGFTLQSFDYGAYRAAYGDVVATYAEQLGKAQGLTQAQIKQGMPDLIKQLDESIHELADQAGLYATFQDETLLSEGAQLVKQGLNAITDFPMQKLVKSGMLPRKFSTEGFGLGDIVLKYARTPANLVMRGIDYSPIGLLRGIGYLMPLFKPGAKFNQFEATRALSRAITGTLGLTGMGYVLADAGVLTGSYSMDKDVRSIEEQSGQGSYKVNFSAMQRFIMGGLDKDAAKFQKGDKIMDYAWLQPAAISVAMGVNANKAMKERKDGDISGWKVVQKAILGGLSSVLENPMVQGLTNVIDAGTEVIKYQKADKLKGIVKGVPASFVPTLSNQARTATDNTQRETFDENLLTEMGNMIKNKIPGWSKSLPASYDSLGKPRERIQGGEENTVGQYLTAFFSPARFTEYKVGPEAKLVLNLMEQSGDKNVLPRVSDKSIEIDNPLTKKSETVKLTNEQYSRLQKQVGEETSKKLQDISDFLANPSVRTEVKVKRVKDILSDVGQKARNDVRAEMGYRKKAIR